MSSSVLGQQNDLFICGLYILPENSRYFDDEIFNNLENDMETYTKKGNMILLGDFNARTGMYKDNVSKEGSNFISNDS